VGIRIRKNCNDGWPISRSPCLVTLRNCLYRERAVPSHVRDLFDEAQEIETANTTAPLATRMRPRSLEEFVGQEHILGPGKLLRRAIEADRLPSVIFYGPPGSGKTTLARVIAEMTHAKFVRISGVESNVAEMRRVLAAATNRLRTSGKKTILFVDEIHHFNKAQQDILLPDVEAGNLRLIGATTYNPYFYVNSALVSRSQVFRLEPLSVQQLEQLIDRALADKERGLGNYNVKMDKDARRHLAKLSDGDARKCLNALEIGVLTTPAVTVDAAPPPRLHYFDSSAPVGRLRGGNLPHWRQDGAMYFVTWRTADSMPGERADQWMKEREVWLKAHPEPWRLRDEEEYYRLFPDRWEAWLDEGHGESLLGRPEIRQIVDDVLRQDDGTTYRLEDFIVMPNHVHVLVSPLGTHTLSEITQAWKSTAAHRINKLLGRSGTFWQKESFDHIVRSAEQAQKFRGYIQQNPRGLRGAGAAVAFSLQKSGGGAAATIHFTLAVAEESIQQKAVVYDRVGDAHYDTISAFIKSVRASDEKSAMYWLAKMLHAGEDFRFIARRIVIFASEDVGLADPEALQLAIATQQAVEFVGMPEARIPLAHATAYMCRAAKSREAYDALNAATEKVEREHTERVPEHLKNIHFPVNPKG
jgi:replication-associated recombination protein RarA/REP element-mobilizing transposase RayT